MFDYKILFFTIPLIIILVLAYREIYTLKQSISEIDTELKHQTTCIASNVNQCVERIEKISKIHINELQNINKLNNQKINKTKMIITEEMCETDGLSKNYMSPENNIRERVHGTDDEQEKNLYDSEESIQFPLYEPTNTSHVTEENSDADDMDVDTPIIGGTNIIGTLMKFVSANDIQVTPNNINATKTHPIIEPVSDTISKVSTKSNTDNISSQTEQSKKSMTSRISRKSKSDTVNDTEQCVSERSSSSKKTQSSRKSNVSRKKSESVERHVQHDGMKPITEYTLQELKEIAKTNGIPTTTKTDGKVRQYKKSEIYELLNKK